MSADTFPICPIIKQGIKVYIIESTTILTFEVCHPIFLLLMLPPLFRGSFSNFLSPLTSSRTRDFIVVSKNGDNTQSNCLMFGFRRLHSHVFKKKLLFYHPSLNSSLFECGTHETPNRMQLLEKLCQKSDNKLPIEERLHSPKCFYYPDSKKLNNNNNEISLEPLLTTQGKKNYLKNLRYREKLSFCCRKSESASINSKFDDKVPVSGDSEVWKK